MAASIYSKLHSPLSCDWSRPNVRSKQQFDMLHSPSWNACIFSLPPAKTHEGLLFEHENGTHNIPVAAFGCCLVYPHIPVAAVGSVADIWECICFYAIFAKKTLCNHKKGYILVLSMAACYVHQMVQASLVWCQSQSTGLPDQFGFFSGHHFWEQYSFHPKSLLVLSA